MALTDLTLDDILEEQIDQRAFEAPAPAGTRKVARQKRSDGKYRVRKGEYNMVIESVQLKEKPDGRRFATIRGALENARGVFRGGVFMDISWQFRTRKDGKLDLASRMFQALVAALGAPANVTLGDFIEGIQQETVHVEVSEYFLVPFDQLVPEDQEGRTDNGYLQKIYINDTDADDAKANHYLDIDLRSRGEVLGITAIG